VRRWRALLLASSALAAAGCDNLGPRSAGEKIWRERCADCHGIDGAGNTPRYMGDPWADLTDAAWKGYGGDRSGLEASIREGSFPDMPAFDQLSAEEMKALLDHIARLRGETP
jgi:mono/diheme cytochrome c family protein